MRTVLVLVIIFPSLILSDCPGGSIEMPKPRNSNMKDSCFVLLTWAEIAVLRAYVIKDRAGAISTPPTAVINAPDIAVNNKKEALKLCKNIGELNSYNQHWNTTNQDLITQLYAGYTWRAPPKWAIEWEKITKTGVTFRTPTQTKKDDMEELVKFMNNRMIKVYHRFANYHFFMEAKYDEATGLALMSTSNGKWNNVLQKGCLYYEVTRGVGAIHRLNCTKAISDNYRPDDNFTQSQMVLCEFDEPEDCVMTSETVCFSISNKVCKMYNKTTIVNKGHKLGKPCRPSPIQPPADQLSDCNADAKQCMRNCRWGPWSDWGDCEYGEEDVTRTRTPKQAAWFGGADCRGTSSEVHCCMINKPLRPCTASKITQPAFIILQVTIAVKTLKILLKF